MVEGTPSTSASSSLTTRRTKAPPASRRAIRVGAVLALALGAGFVAWLLIDGEDKPVATPSALPATMPPQPAQIVMQPAIRSTAELRATAATSAIPIFWAGGRPPARLEYSSTSDGSTFVRYLPADAAAGDLEPQLTVATYVRPAGFEEVQSAATKDSETIELAEGGIAVYDRASPTNVHLAYPGQPYQVEVFAPTAGLALELVRSGAVRALG